MYHPSEHLVVRAEEAAELAHSCGELCLRRRWASVSETDYIALVDNGDSTVTVSVVSSTVTDTVVLEAADDRRFLASLSSTLEVDITFTSAPEATTIFVLSPPPPAPPAAPSNG